MVNFKNTFSNTGSGEISATMAEIFEFRYFISELQPRPRTAASPSTLAYMDIYTYTFAYTHMDIISLKIISQ